MFCDLAYFACRIAPAASKAAPTTATGLPWHELGRKHDWFSGESPPCDLPQQQFDGLIAHLKERHAHAAQGRLMHDALRPVIEADHGHVLGDAQPRGVSAAIAPNADSSLEARTAVKGAPVARIAAMAAWP